MTEMVAQNTIRDPVSVIVNEALVDPGRVEFLLLIGVMVGLSIGRLVSFVGECLVHRKKIAPSLTHGTFLLTLFIYQVFYWWDMWELKALLGNTEITFPVFTRLLFIPVCLYCATALLCPQLKLPEGDEKFSLADHFFEHKRPFYFIWFAICLIATLQAADLRAEGWGSTEILIRLASGSLFLAGLLIGNSVFDLILSFTVLALLVGFILIVGV